MTAMARPGFSFYICPDSGLLRRKLEEDVASQGPGWERRIFWADDGLPPSFWDALSLPGLMGGSRAVVLRRAEVLCAEDWGKLEPVLGRFQSRIWPMLCLEGEWKGGQPPVPAALSSRKPWAVAGAKGWVWTSPGMTRKQVAEVVSSWAGTNGLSFAPGVRDVLVSSLPMEAAALKSELEKVFLALAGRVEVMAGDLDVVLSTAEMDIFALLDAVVRSREPARVWEQVLASRLGSDQTMIFPFIALLLREARILWQLESGEENEVRLPYHAKNAKQDLARRIGLANLSRIWHLSFEADLGIKTGRLSPEQAIEYLVSGLMLLFRPAK
jgi:DNA polymerase III subunit delta